jgi:hypothetical protein
MKNVFIAYLLAMSGQLAFAGGDHAGNGGDFLRIIFEKGRTNAVGLVQKLKSCQLPSNVPGDIRNWILIHQNELAIDLRGTHYIWSIDSNQTCAFTQTIRSADIELSYEACRPTIRNEEDAARVLLHETAHHFGITDENFADWVSYAISEANTEDTCSGNSGSDVFNSNYCASAPMTAGEAIGHLNLPGSSTGPLGEFNVNTRYRNCYTVGGCTSWLDGNTDFSPLQFFGFQDERTYENHDIKALFAAMPVTGQLSIALVNNSPQLMLNSATGELNAWWSTQGPLTHWMDYQYKLRSVTEVNGQPVALNLYSSCEMHRMRDNTGRWTPYGDCERHIGRFPDKLTSLAGSDGHFRGRLGNDCLWIYQNGSVDRVDGSGNTFTTESEAVVTGKF